MKDHYKLKKDRKLRIVFLGNPGYGGEILSELLKCNVNVIAVFTKSKNRLHNLKRFIKFKLSSFKKFNTLSNNIVDKLETYGSDSLKFENFGKSVEKALIDSKVNIFDGSAINKKDNIEIMKKWNIDLILVATFGEFLSASVLDLPQYGCINIHPSLLPKYRGGFPEFCTVMNGDESSGITFHYMEPSFDTGDIIFQKEIDLEEGTNTINLKKQLSNVACENLNLVIEKIRLGNIEKVRQSSSDVSYCSIDSNTHIINKKMSVAQIKNKIFSHQGENFDPYFFLGNEKVRVLSCGESGYSFDAYDGRIVFDIIKYKKRIYSKELINQIFPSQYSSK